MRLNMPPKEALQAITDVIEDGDRRMWSIRNWCAEKLDYTKRDGGVIPPEYFEDDFYALPKDGDKLKTEDVVMWSNMFWEWEEKATNVLKAVYADGVPVVEFLNAYAEHPRINHHPALTHYYKIHRTFKMQIQVLVGYYRELAASMKSPLMYLPDQAKICFYDFVCPLAGDTNEAALCGCLFGHSIGDKIEMIEAHNHITGEDRIKLNPAQKRVVTNAYDGINRKAKAAFGFPIVKKDGVTISLTLPTRITSALS